jgi:hypothetical protein
MDAARQSVNKWKVVSVFALSAFLLLLVLCVAYIAFPALWLKLAAREMNVPAVITQVKKLNQLVTVKYSIQRVVGLAEPKVPFGEESILLMVEGQALAGVDLNELTADDVSPRGTHPMRVMLPRSKMMQVFLDEKRTKVWDRHVTWWTPWAPYDPELEHKARLSALDDVRSAAVAMGILQNAQRNAQVVIEGFLHSLGIEAQVVTRPS